MSRSSSVKRESPVKLREEKHYTGNRKECSRENRCSRLSDNGFVVKFKITREIISRGYLQERPLASRKRIMLRVTVVTIVFRKSTLSY